jgi:hypothetical protein
VHRAFFLGFSYIPLNHILKMGARSAPKFIFEGNSSFFKPRVSWIPGVAFSSQRFLTALLDSDARQRCLTAMLDSALDSVAGQRSRQRCLTALLDSVA